MVLGVILSGIRMVYGGGRRWCVVVLLHRSKDKESKGE